MSYIISVYFYSQFADGYVWRHCNKFRVSEGVLTCSLQPIHDYDVERFATIHEARKIANKLLTREQKFFTVEVKKVRIEEIE